MLTEREPAVVDVPPRRVPASSRPTSVSEVSISADFVPVWVDAPCSGANRWLRSLGRSERRVLRPSLLRRLDTVATSRAGDRPPSARDGAAGLLRSRPNVASGSTRVIHLGTVLPRR